MKTTCHYAVVRFMPFVETGEFANVGVVLFSPGRRFFGFRLLHNRHARITNFFEQLDPKMFKGVMRVARDELQRIANRFKECGTDKRYKALDSSAAFLLWSELTKPLATMLQVGESRVAIAEDPQVKLQELYNYYVERNFVTKEYQEEVLNRNIRGLLKSVGLAAKYRPLPVGNQDYHARFPFVATADHVPVQIIKPLHLGYDDSTKIIDHGGQWIVKVAALRNRKLLPENVLFAIDGTLDQSRQGVARAEIVSQLQRYDVQVAHMSDVNKVKEFAMRAPVLEGLGLEARIERSQLIREQVRQQALVWNQRED